jgi:hypothetical protein
MSQIDKTKNIFVSHFSEDEENIGKMKDLLASKGYQIKNSSIDSTKDNDASNEEYIKSLLRPRIEWAGTFICLIGPKTHTREWVDWEIEQAHKQGKPIVGVYINGASGSDVPDNFNKYGTALVGWTGDKVIDAIQGKINNFENPDGSKREPIWTSPRTTCN